MSSSQNKSKINLFLDIAVFIAFILAMAPHVTGIPVHEWLSLAFALAIVVHLLLHWEWIVGVAGQYFARLWHESRFNFFVDAIFFLALVMIMVSGLAISKVALPLVGVTPPFSIVWKQAHRISAEVGLITLGIHCGMHAKWIVQNGKRYLIDPALGLFKKKAAAEKAVAGGKR